VCVCELRVVATLRCVNYTKETTNVQHTTMGSGMLNTVDSRGCGFVNILIKGEFVLFLSLFISYICFIQMLGSSRFIQVCGAFKNGFQFFTIPIRLY
jgi:hypothetical protein